jgi:hypothetical protein
MGETDFVQRLAGVPGIVFVVAGFRRRARTGGSATRQRKPDGRAQEVQPGARQGPIEEPT